MGIKSQYMTAVVNTTNSDNQVTVSAGATVSSILTCGGTAPVGIFFPSNFTSCNVTINVSNTPDGTFVPVTNFDGTALTIAGAASQFTPLYPAMFNSVLYLQLGFSEAQNSEIITVQLAPIYQGVHA